MSNVYNDIDFQACNAKLGKYIFNPVEELPELSDTDRNHAYILPDNTVWIPNYLKTEWLKLNNDEVPNIPNDKIAYLFSETQGRELWRLSDPSTLMFTGGTMKIVKGATDLDTFSLYVEQAELPAYPGVCYYIEIDRDANMGRIAFTNDMDFIYNNDDYYAVGFAHGWSTLVPVVVSIFGNNVPLIWLSNAVTGEYMNYMDAFYRMFRDNPGTLYSSDGSIIIEKSNDGIGTDLTVDRGNYQLITSLSYTPDLTRLAKINSSIDILGTIDDENCVGTLYRAGQNLIIETLTYVGIKKTVRVYLISFGTWSIPDTYYDHLTTPLVSETHKGYMSPEMLEKLNSLNEIRESIKKIEDSIEELKKERISVRVLEDE